VFLFGEGPRNLEGGAPFGAGPFTYLNESARPEATRVRELIERFLAAYPPVHRDALVRRLQSDEHEVHWSAFFELSLHQLLNTNAFEVVEIEPAVPGTDKRPDFLVQSPGGQRFYVEAVLATGLSDKARGQRKRIESIRKMLDSIVHDRFLLDVHEIRFPDVPVRTGHLRKQILEWLDSLDKETVRRARRSSLLRLPMMRLGDGTWQIDLRALPRKTPVGSKAKRGIGVFSGPGGLIESPSDSIRDSLRKKAGRYGALDLPFFVAVNATTEFHNMSDFEDALFGTLTYVGLANGSGYQTRLWREMDGVWRRPGRPANTRLSGILCFSKLKPWQVARCKTRIIENPWAARPLDLEALGLSIARVEKDRLVTKPGHSLATIFNLSEEWPE
jgi:hypothetical protein